VQQQQNNTGDDWKQSFNIAYGVALIHQRGIVVLNRDRWGKNALGKHCALAFVLMFFWAGFTQDVFMYGWLALWCIAYFQRRIEASKLVGQVHTYSDGRANQKGSNEKMAKTVYEPIIVGIMGVVLRCIYIENGWPTGGLPTFLLVGCFTLPLVESVKQQAWDRKLDAMNDARIENEQLQQEYRDRFGN
jgi:hypothetical protein